MNDRRFSARSGTHQADVDEVPENVVVRQPVGVAHERGVDVDLAHPSTESRDGDLSPRPLDDVRGVGRPDSGPVEHVGEQAGFGLGLDGEPVPEIRQALADE